MSAKNIEAMDTLEAELASRSLEVRKPVQSVTAPATKREKQKTLKADAVVPVGIA